MFRCSHQNMRSRLLIVAFEFCTTLVHVVRVINHIFTLRSRQQWRIKIFISSETAVLIPLIIYSVAQLFIRDGRITTSSFAHSKTHGICAMIAIIVHNLASFANPSIVHHFLLPCLVSIIALCHHFRCVNLGARLMSHARVIEHAQLLKRLTRVPIAVVIARMIRHHKRGIKIGVAWIVSGASTKARYFLRQYGFDDLWTRLTLYFDLFASIGARHSGTIIAVHIAGFGSI
mmetsp:Transcript_27420/g.45111  ORF Transcript_27420/g.45111 Transcript_27420/m.45111 type:complete len:231 (+) Transcript_27420:339-1031(+)